MCVWTAIRSATKRLLVRILRTQQFVTYWCGFLRRTIDKILFKHKIRIWLKSAVWYATALNQLEGIKSRPSTGIILAFIEAQIWSTGYCTETVSVNLWRSTEYTYLEPIGIYNEY